MAFEALLGQYLPNLVFIIIVITGVVILEVIIDDLYKRYTKKRGVHYGAQVSEVSLRLLIFFVGIFVILSNIPGVTSNMVRLAAAAIGIILAFSSTTMIANGMAGILIRMLKSYGLGDMVKIKEHVGRVSEIGIFHTEIQTPKRGLVTVPNHVVMSDLFINYTEQKYIVNIPVSISYSVDRKVVEDLLIKAVKDTGLEEPFVLIKELNGSYVVYEANGLLKDVSQLVVIESNLRKNILDEFNKAKIEILSPEYRAWEEVPKGYKVIPEEYKRRITKKRIEAEKKEEKEMKKEAKESEKVMFEKATEEEEKAKEEILAKNFSAEAMAVKPADISKWAQEKGVKIPKGATRERIRKILIKDDKISLEDLQIFFKEKVEEAAEKGKEKK